jgi:hypothetical protein
MSDPSSAAQVASTSGSSEPASASSPNARRIRGDDGSSSGIGPTSRAPRTFAKSRRAGENDPSPESWKPSDLAPTLDAAGHGPRTATLVCSAAASPAKTGPSPVSDSDLRDIAPASSSNSPGSQMSFNHDGSWSKTSQGFSPLPTAETLPSFCQRWPTSGMASHGGYLTLATSESPSGAVECSLSDVLEATPSPRYALSAKAAAGILRRARARGRELPAELEVALVTLAATMPLVLPPTSDGISTPRPSSSLTPSEAIRDPDPIQTETLW